MKETKIVIECSGGLVQAVYANGPASVEVIDIDEPDFATQEEEQETEQKRQRIKAVSNDPTFTAVY